MRSSGYQEDQKRAPTQAPFQELSSDTDDDFETDITVIRPVAHRPLSDFTLTERTAPKTAHTVHESIDNETKKIHFIKETSEIMACLEAAATGAYRMSIPRDVMPAYAIYDKNKYIGVASEGIPNFKSLAVDRLTEIDLNFDYLGKSPDEQLKKILILEKLDEEYCKIKNDVEKKEIAISISLKKLKKQKLKNIKKLNEKRAEIEKQFKAFKNIETFSVNQDGEPTVSPASEARRLKKILRAHNIEKEELFKEYKANKEILEFKQINLACKINRFFEQTCTKQGFRPDEFNRYRIVKSLANGTIESFVYIEEDLHRNNVSKNGRFDFDMSFWPLFNDFKDKSLADRAFRTPGKHHLAVTWEDIINFPNTESFLPYFWPTNQARSTSISSTTNIIKSVKSYLGVPDNNYEIRDNELFQRLSTHPVFKYHKYVNLTKCILMTKNICRQNAEKHIPPELIHTYNGKKDYLINHFVDLHESRIHAFRKALLQIPEFHDFFKEHHERIAEEFLRDLKEQGITYTSNEINEATRFLEAKETPENDPNSPAAHIKQVSKNILISIDNQKKAWADKVENSLQHYTESLESVQKKMALYAPCEGYLSSLWGGIWKNNISAEDKSSAEKIIKEISTLPQFIDNNKNTLGCNIYLASMKKLHDGINKEVESFKKKIDSNSNETKEELKGLYKDLIDLKNMIEKYLPNEMLSPVISVVKEKPTPTTPLPLPDTTSLIMSA